MAMLFIMENGLNGASLASASATPDVEGEQDGAKVARLTMLIASALTKRANHATLLMMLLNVPKLESGLHARFSAAELDLELALSTELLKRKSAVITRVGKSQNGATGRNVLSAAAKALNIAHDDATMDHAIISISRNRDSVTMAALLDAVAITGICHGIVVPFTTASEGKQACESSADTELSQRKSHGVACWKLVGSLLAVLLLLLQSGQSALLTASSLMTSQNNSESSVV